MVEGNTESKVDLGRQRLKISSSLGTEFALEIESGSVKSEIVKKVKEHLINNPGTQILGYKFAEGDSLSSIVDSLNQQVGLPQGARFIDIRDRLDGRDDDFILVIIDKENLSPREQRKLQRQVNKFKIPALYGTSDK